MDREVKARYSLRSNTVAYWENRSDIVPLYGEPIIYVDYKTNTEGLVTKNVPGIKIGDGVHTVAELEFVSDIEAERLYEHIRNTYIHVTPEQKLYWTSSINDLYERTMLISSEEYAELEERGEVDPNKIYMVYEEEE